VAPSTKYQWHFYNNRFWIGDHFLTSFRPTCLHSYFTFFINKTPEWPCLNISRSQENYQPPKVWKCKCEQSNRSGAHGKTVFHSTMRKGRPRQRVLTVDYAIWGALQQTVYRHQSVSSVVELKRAIAKAWQKRSRSSTKVSMNGVVVWSAHHFCTV